MTAKHSYSKQYNMDVHWTCIWEYIMISSVDLEVPVAILKPKLELWRQSFFIYLHKSRLYCDEWQYNKLILR